MNIEKYLETLGIECDVVPVVYNARNNREIHNRVRCLATCESCWRFMLEEEGCFITPEEIKRIEACLKDEEINWKKLK